MINNLSKELVEMQILLRKYKVPQRSIDKIINREKSMKEEVYEYKQLIDTQNKRKYHKKYLEERRKEEPNLLYPDYDEIYKRYYEQKNKIDKLERQIKIKDAWAYEIKWNLWGYDGCENSIPGLRGLVDEAIDKSEKIMNCDDKSIVTSGLRNGYVEHKNVLGEVLTKFTEKDQKWINSEEYKYFWSLDGEDNGTL